MVTVAVISPFTPFAGYPSLVVNVSFQRVLPTIHPEATTDFEKSRYSVSQGFPKE